MPFFQGLEKAFKYCSAQTGSNTCMSVSSVELSLHVSTALLVMDNTHSLLHPILTDELEYPLCIDCVLVTSAQDIQHDDWVTDST